MVLASLPNIITFGRLLAVPLAVLLILDHELDWAFWLFVAAGVSDALDGALARLLRARSALGAYLDPLADKALLVTVYIALGHEGYLPKWLVILVVFRDVMIVGAVLLLYTLKESLAMQPLWISKFNTLAQIALAALVLAVHGIGFPNPTVFGVTLTQGAVWFIAATTVISGAAYLRRGNLLFNPYSGGPQR